MTKTTLGAIVLYTTASGATLPAVVVHISDSGPCNLQVFTDESLPNILHITDVEQTASPAAGKFHFAANASETATENNSAPAQQTAAGKGE